MSVSGCWLTGVERVSCEASTWESRLRRHYQWSSTAFFKLWRNGLPEVCSFFLKTSCAIAVAACPRLAAIKVAALAPVMCVLHCDELEELFPIRSFFLRGVGQSQTSTHRTPSPATCRASGLESLSVKFVPDALVHFWHDAIAMRNLRKSVSSIAMNRNGCNPIGMGPEHGSSNSAMPNTGPASVQTITSTTAPGLSGLRTRSKPPVAEMV